MTDAIKKSKEERDADLDAEARIVRDIEDSIDELDYTRRVAVLQYVLSRQEMDPVNPTYADGSDAGPGTQPPES